MIKKITSYKDDNHELKGYTHIQIDFEKKEKIRNKQKKLNCHHSTKYVRGCSSN